MSSEISLQGLVEKIYLGMWWTNVILHPWRNNARTTNKYYWMLVSLKEINKNVQKDIEVSRYSFDRLFGICKALHKLNFTEEEVNEEKEWCDELLKDIKAKIDATQYFVDACKKVEDEKMEDYCSMCQQIDEKEIIKYVIQKVQNEIKETVKEDTKKKINEILLSKNDNLRKLKEEVDKLCNE